VEDWLIHVLEEHGLFGALFALSLFIIKRLYEGRLEDRQKEIDRLAQENHDYRDKFMVLLNNKIKKEEKENE